MSGIKKPYPVKLYDATNNKHLTISSDEELVDLISNKIAEPIKGERKGLNDILWELGIGELEEVNSVQIMCKRSKALIEQYQYFSTNVSLPYGADPLFIWYEAVLIMQKIFNVRVF